MKIQILGVGCPRCEQLEKRVRDTLAELDIAAEVEHVTDLQQFASMGVFMTPGLAIDGRVVSQGKVPDRKEIRSWLAPPEN